MKHITYILIFLILTSCSQSNSYKESQREISAETNTIKVEPKVDSTRLDLKQSSTEQTEHNNHDLSYEFKEATVFKLSDTINADFN